IAETEVGDTMRSPLSPYCLFALIILSSLCGTYSFIDDEFGTRQSIRELYHDDVKDLASLMKKIDPSWRYIGLGKRSERGEEFIKRLPANRYAMIGLGR
uniref:Uncharacterized protein n=2 Tax=Parascaris TaxID=6254 RepID=A0A914ZXU5_PARUN